MPIERVGVIGAGTMGNGIAHVFARSGYRVTLCDVEQRFLDRGLETIGKNLDRELAKGKITAGDKAAALKRIEPVLKRGDLVSCDFVIEAATEKFEIKAEIFRDLDQICRPEVILAIEYVFDFDHPAGRGDAASGENYWHAFLQSRAGHEAGGSDSRAGHLAGNFRHGARPGIATRQDADRSKRRARLCFEPRADAACSMKPCTR